MKCSPGSFVCPIGNWRRAPTCEVQLPTSSFSVLILYPAFVICSYLLLVLTTFSSLLVVLTTYSLLTTGYDMVIELNFSQKSLIKITTFHWENEKLNALEKN